MLILTRRVGETIKVGDDVEVCVLGFHGQAVRIGIDAPKYVTVHRAEVYRRIEEEQGHPVDVASPTAPGRPAITYRKRKPRPCPP